MKFIVSSSKLLSRLSRIKGVISNNPVVPILENFLFDLKEGQLSITSSDLQNSMIVSVKVDSSDTGAIAVPAKILIDTLSNLPDQPVTFNVDHDTCSIEIFSENGRYKMSGEMAGDFPKLPAFNSDHPYMLSSEVLSKAIEYTSFAVSSDELRLAMTGMYIRFSDDGVTFVSTDGHRLVVFSHTAASGSEPAVAIIPQKAIKLAKSLLKDTENVVVQLSSTNARFVFSDEVLICRLIDERYPDYSSVVPKDNDKQIVVVRSQILGALRRVSSYANKTTHRVKLSISNNQISLSAEDVDYNNEADERIPCQYQGDPIEIGFNSNYLLQCINAVPGSEIELSFKAPNTASVIRPLGDSADDLLILQMPVMLVD